MEADVCMTCGALTSKKKKLTTKTLINLASLKAFLHNLNCYRRSEVLFNLSSSGQCSPCLSTACVPAPQQLPEVLGWGLGGGEWDVLG